MDRNTLRTVSGGGFRPPRIPLGAVVPVLAGAILLWAVFSSFFTVEAEEVGLILRFGRYVRQVEPGLRVKFPWPVESAIKVEVQRQKKMEFGFRTIRPGVRTQYAEQDFPEESLMLTGDLNVANVQWITQYRIQDPYKYTFRVRSVDATFRDMNEAVMREVVGDRSVNEVLTVGRQEIMSEVERKLQELCDQYETGIKVEQVVLQDVNPPDPVKPSFNEVNQAQQEKERMINDAMAEYNRDIPKARGEALRTVQQAEGYAADRVNRAKGDATAFTAVLSAYREAPDVTRRRIYLETMEAVLPKAKRKVILDAQAKTLLPLLSLEGGK